MKVSDVEMEYVDSKGIKRAISIKDKVAVYKRVAEKKDFKVMWAYHKTIEDLKELRLVLSFDVFACIAYHLQFGMKWADVKYKEWVDWAIAEGVIKDREEIIGL